MGLENVSHILLVLSGKGGVGKSSVTLQLALSLCQLGHNVGILDIDLTGPSIPRLLGLEDKKVTQAPGGWLPVQVHEATSPQRANGVSQHLASSSADENDTDFQALADGIPRGSLHAISLAFLLPSRSSAVIWRGPKKTAMIRQFVSDVLWPQGTDYLLIDTPPGTSDEHIAIAEELHKLAGAGPATSLGTSNKLAGAVVVTTPQAISTADVRKELNFCVKTQVPVLGVIENMAGYVCPCCGEVSNVFNEGGGQIMARESGVPFLGSVPIDTGFGAMVEGGDEEEGPDSPHTKQDLVERYRKCGLCAIFLGFARTIVEKTA